MLLLRKKQQNNPILTGMVTASKAFFKKPCLLFYFYTMRNLYTKYGNLFYAKITIRANIVQFLRTLLQFSEKTGTLYVIPIRWGLIAMRKGTTFSRNRLAFLGKQFRSQKITYNTGAQLA